mmetsp:Transcript_5892/g.8475  ORF Transcript_5892/g.8475 Transcript_5892/m.8475 type:complete len:207 (+) Transcript_5892:1758-2378(+)
MLQAGHLSLYEIVLPRHALKGLTTLPFISCLALKDLSKLLHTLFPLSERGLLELAILPDPSPVGKQDEYLLDRVMHNLHLIKDVLAISSVLDINLGESDIEIRAIAAAIVCKHCHAGTVKLAYAAHLGHNSLGYISSSIVQSHQRCIGVGLKINIISSNDALWLNFASAIADLCNFAKVSLDFASGARYIQRCFSLVIFDVDRGTS